jgi:hypothetical protein
MGRNRREHNHGEKIEFPNASDKYASTSGQGDRTPASDSRAATTNDYDRTHTDTRGGRTTSVGQC